MGKLFGTDGIRGLANQYPMDCETALKAGRAVAAFFEKNGSAGGRFLIGQDTRISGGMLVNALAAGISSMGKTVCLTGVLPTPGVAHLTAADGFDAGVVISASHNPYYDNGIKLFGHDGFKLSDADEQSVEQQILDDRRLMAKSRNIQHVGSVQHLEDAPERYGRFLARCVDSGPSLAGIHVVIDCSNGAASRIAPTLFQTLGAAVTRIFFQPDGININADCGSEHPDALAQRVRAEGAHLGVALDGDADRLVAVDENGNVLSGDQVIAICAKIMLETGQLENPTVVTTVMSNLGLRRALKQMGIAHIQAGVGDRNVMQEMLKADAVLGGENSGHMIFLKHHTTGDGILAALKLMQAMVVTGKSLSELATVMTVFPQCLINVDVAAKPPIDTIAEVVAAIGRVEQQLGEKGRVLVRYSGTQPQCRVMVEGPTQSQTRDFCRQIATVIAKTLA